MNNRFPIGQKINLSGHFNEPVILEAVREIFGGYELQVRLLDGSLDEAILSPEEAATISDEVETTTKAELADAEKIRLLIESARIRLAYAHDSQFAVSISGIRTLPHQIEAVYLKMLPQPRLRFLLADDPGAGKTIMAGLLLKEMKLREAIERILILCPAPLTIQWQDELLRWFGEPFDIIFSALDQQQLVNPWQRNTQVISSIDYAKQEDVRKRVWQQRWDLVIIDEAHKCSAYTKHRSGRADEVEKTKRYQLAERLAYNADHLLLLTATPHHGDDDRFGHFIRLIDPDIFPEPHKVGQKAREIRTDILRLGPDCPWSVRRLKEDLKDFEGKRLFPDRHASTVTFRLNREEYDLYKAVTAYLNEFLGQAAGRRKQSVALARTVFQRRLASSTGAIYESMKRRLEKQRNLLEELEVLTPAQRSRRLAQLQGRLTDAELDEDDLDDEARDILVDEFTVSMELDQLRMEIANLKELTERAKRVKERSPDSKLSALKECLTFSEFSALKDGRGKLIIFTEHRDTLNHLKEHLEKWGYSTCEIHGGMNPHQRKEAQEKFRTTSQICVATEAAGEGINLQFCHLMINYDLPWNPTRLEQRLGRIHRIGQERDVYVFNFVASESEEGQPIIEGRILQRLLDKLEQIRAVLSDRVFDVIGEVLSLNEINLSEMLREAAFDPRRLEEYLDQIERIDPQKLKAYEEATGIALAKSTLDFSNFHHSNVEIEERRLMPRYVEQHFLNSAEEVGLKIESRADGLWRIPHVLADLRSDRLDAVRRLGKPEPNYRKITFHKEHLDMNQHLDAVLLGPGQPLYASVDEKLNEKLSSLLGHAGAFIDVMADYPYALHFFEMTIRGMANKGKPHTLYGEVAAIREELTESTDVPHKFSVIPADCLIDLPSHPNPPTGIQSVDPKPAADFLKTSYQMDKRKQCQQEREHFTTVCREYLEKSFTVRIHAAQDRVMHLKAREKDSPEVALARQRAENDLTDLKRMKDERLTGLDRLSIARHGPIKHIASALVFTPACAKRSAAGRSVEVIEPQLMEVAREIDPELRRKIELAAEDIVIKHETTQGRECERVGHLKIGFDIRSLAQADPQTGYRDPMTGVRRIEVKGRKKGHPIRLTTNEWYKATQLGDSYWLYVVWEPLENPDAEPIRIQNPAQKLDHVKQEVVTARFFEIPANAIAQMAERS
jgi:SNF2 family DNA or RNA helicase